MSEISRDPLAVPRPGAPALRATVVALTMVVLACLLAAALTTDATARDGRGKPERVSPVDAKLTACASPALAPGLRIAERPRRGRDSGVEKKARAVARIAYERGMVARAQALAVTAVLSGEIAGAAQGRDFLKRLAKLDRWRTLPPTIVIHRVLRTPDPFAYEPHWQRAVNLLGSFAQQLDGSAERVVSVGGRAPKACRASAADTSALPLPAGSSYEVEQAGSAPGATPEPSATATTSGKGAGKAAGPGRGRGGAERGATAARRPAEIVVPDGQETRFVASCGTPVLAAAAGTVEVIHDDLAAGPWLIRVRNGSGDVVIDYAHVQNPTVANGATVLVGQQLAEVGDLGDVDQCALGLAVRTRVDGALVMVDPLRWLTSQLPTPEPERPMVPETRFRVASYNVLGHHLTVPGGSKRGWAPGTTRVANGLARLEAAGVSIVVLNEFESPQASVVLADGDWGLHRATPNNVFRDGNSNGNAVAWRVDTWKLIASDEFTVPWSTRLHMPVVYLQHLTTGAIVGVIGIHNPASTARAGNQQGARELARGIELDWIAQHLDTYPDIPVILAGDFNERDTAFCGLTAGGLLASSAGGSVGPACSVPRHGPVDWIFGTLGVQFLSQYIDRGFLGSISDHPLVSADVLFGEHRAPDLG
ncbi:peptidoglycan DD-metalloendopeptidase family protein [Nocardioides sp. R-C-SC26]|uniref:peptidoglycan DD-metalloendopeptidase family protein n=1 Tax=Nocardioides sp. R-C-SC26 TaxID=2870414 RepID=UPI001E5AE87D|nr:peptidoglycan DD-metalloendopeptidase family protein [Nocardioides sp. R-C-SC26]